MSSVVGIVPAAGLSSRMGAFKPLLPVDAENGEGCVSALERAVTALRAAGAGRVFVVTGKSADKLRPAAEELGSAEMLGDLTALTAQEDMMAATMEKARGTSHTGTLLLIQAESMSMVPALTATEISMPAPAIIRMVFQGTLAMISFWGASFISRAMTAKTMATRPTSILPATSEMNLTSGRMSFSTGKTRTTAIIRRMRVRVFFWTGV